MSIQKTEAVVLKSQKLGETSKIIHLFSKKYGKIKVVAKGARGIKSHFYGTLEPLNYIHIVFYHKDNRELQLISQADISESFDNLRKNLDKIALAFFAGEMIMKSQAENDPNPNMFNLFIALLYKLNEDNQRFENYLSWFQIKFLKLTGFKPGLSFCCNCRSQVPINKKNYFSITQGGCLCSNCNKMNSQSILLSGPALHYLQSIEVLSLDKIGEIVNTHEIIQESLFVLNKFMEFHIEPLKNLKSIKFMNDIRKHDSINALNMR